LHSGHPYLELTLMRVVGRLNEVKPLLLNVAGREHLL